MRVSDRPQRPARGAFDCAGMSRRPVASDRPDGTINRNHGRSRWSRFPLINTCSSCRLSILIHRKEGRAGWSARFRAPAATRTTPGQGWPSPGGVRLSIRQPCRIPSIRNFARSTRPFGRRGGADRWRIVRISCFEASATGLSPGIHPRPTIPGWARHLHCMPVLPRRSRWPPLPGR